MVSARKVCAYLLLVVFQMFVLHQALPHVHHVHEENQTTAHNHPQLHTHHHQVDNHNHNHHHDHNTDKKQDQTTNHHQGLLGYLLGTHSHSNGLSHTTIITNPTVQSHKVKDLGMTPLTTLKTVLEVSDTRISQSVYVPPDKLHHSYNPSVNHRGPPANI